MIRISNFLIILLLVISIHSEEKWWPKKCNSVDKTIAGADTFVVKYKCIGNGRKAVIHKKNGKYHGKYIAWSSNGIKIEDLTYFEDELDGEIKGWDTTGFLISHRYYNKGIPYGFHEDYYSKAKPKSFIKYDSLGKKHGLCQTWREDGTRIDSTVYVNDTIIETRQYYTNGKLRYWVKKCQDDIREEALFYAPDGKKSGEIIKGNGKYTVYSEDGRDSTSKEYRDGKDVTK